MFNIWDIKILTDDIDNYIRVIQRHGLDSYFNVEKLYDVIDEENFKIKEVEINFYERNPIAKTIPHVKKFSINLINSLCFDPDIDITKNDPIKSCSFDMVLIGFCDDKVYKGAWHLDKHISKDGDGPTKYCHPLYHFQYGGNHMEGLATGEVMLMGAPRIPHPPMDIFLSIHFILNNYFNSQEQAFSNLKQLYEDADYIEILDRAKERMWMPYFRGLTDNANSDLNLARLFPLASA